MRGVPVPYRRVSSPERGPARVVTRPRRTRSVARTAEPLGPHPVEMAGLLHELTARLLSADSFAQALERLAVFAAGAVPGVVRCSIVLIGEGGPLTYAGHGLPGAAVDQIQYAAGTTGPGPESARTRSMVPAPALATDAR